MEYPIIISLAIVFGRFGCASGHTIFGILVMAAPVFGPLVIITISDALRSKKENIIP